MRFSGIILSIFALLTTTVVAQNGDQILDGIGETGLIARYTLNKDVKDWSRNNLHGEVKGSDFKFVKDSVFGNVLALNGNSSTFISIPGESVSGEESLSISGWILPLSDKKGQILFDFGKSKDLRLFVAHTGYKDSDGFQAQILKASSRYISASQSLILNTWNHVVVVVNIPSKSLSTYINGKKAGEVKNVEIELNHIFDADNASENKLFIGKSIEDGFAGLKAKLYDFRLYRIPLTDRQISRIYNIALKKEEPVTRRRGDTEQNLTVYPESTQQLYNFLLTEVPDVQVETYVGNLPRLPRLVDANYKGGFKGPQVRVIWPSPIDNSQVQSPGTYKVTGKIAGSVIKPTAVVKVVETKNIVKPARKLEAFRLEQVTLNTDIHDHKTKFIENRDKFISVLSKTNPDNFLYMFRNAYGQKQPDGAEPLGVWDSQETKLRGHATGHYLSAIAQAYAGTSYDKSLQNNFADKMKYMVDVLYELSRMSGKRVSDPALVKPDSAKSGFDSDLTQKGIRTDYWNWGRGFISAYPPDQFIMLEKGATYGGSNAQIWAPYYTLHKILAGLMDIYEISGNKKALEIVKGMGDWVYTRLSVLPKETLISMWNRYIAGEFGGMNEAMARLYRITKDPKYLKTAQLFDNIKVFYGDASHSHGLSKNVDIFRGLHANQHIPQIIGALEIYRDSNSPEYFNIADNFWYMVTNDYMYSIGGVAGARNPNNAECFTSQPSTLYENGFASGGQNETCATYNMLKLTGDLFLFNQNAEYMDYYERGLYNHILASVAEHSPANTYHVSLRPGSVKQFGNPNMTGFTCCNGTAIESSTKLQNTIYYKSSDNKSLYVNLYIPSVLDWSERKIKVIQSTAYPKEDCTRLTIKGKGRFDLNVRVPHWATGGFIVKINGKEISGTVANVNAGGIKISPKPGSYFTINKSWKDGDVVELKMPFKFYLEPVMDQQNIASLFYGPVLLAAQEPEPRTEWRKITLNAEDISKSISGDSSKLQFTIDGVEFKPFYETYGRHSVYLDVTLK